MARTTGSHSDITGPRIREVALDLFARRGFAAVSMRQIASGVGVQAGALYNYTPDKQTMLFGLMRGHMQELLATWRARDLPVDALQQLRAFTGFHIRFHLERPDAVFIAYMELRNLEPDGFAEIEALRRSYEAELEAILRDGQAMVRTVRGLEPLGLLWRRIDGDFADPLELNEHSHIGYVCWDANTCTR